MDALEGDGFRQVAGVFIVFGLLAGVIWRFRSGPLRPGRMQRGGARLESAGRLGLTPQHAVHLIRVDGRELLVATHPQGCVLLTEKPAEQGRAA